MKVLDLGFVCYAVTGLRAGQAFYESALKLKPTSAWYMDPEKDKGMVEYDIGSSTIAIGCGAPMFAPGGKNVCAALEVEDFGAAVAHLKSLNVKFAMEPQETPVCHMALIEDPDGNPIMIHQRK